MKNLAKMLISHSGLLFWATLYIPVGHLQHSMSMVCNWDITRILTAYLLQCFTDATRKCRHVIHAQT